MSYAVLGKNIHNDVDYNILDATVLELVKLLQLKPHLPYNYINIFNIFKTSESENESNSLCPRQLFFIPCTPCVSYTTDQHIFMFIYLHAPGDWKTSILTGHAQGRITRLETSKPYFVC